MSHETDPVTLCVDKHYKADLRFKTLPLENYDIILCSPWMVDNEATLTFKDKSVSFAHRGRQLTIFPVNLLCPADLAFDHTWAEQSGTSTCQCSRCSLPAHTW
eukprot:303588-Rhodomonas_salina.1